MTVTSSGHGGDRSFERNIDWNLANHIIRTGGQRIQANGNILHEGRDPNNKDHVIQVITTPHPKKIITVIRDTSRPWSQVVAQGNTVKNREQAEKDKVKKSKDNQKLQLAKKHKRNPPKS